MNETIYVLLHNGAVYSKYFTSVEDAHKLCEYEGLQKPYSQYVYALKPARY